MTLSFEEIFCTFLGIRVYVPLNFFSRDFVSDHESDLYRRMDSTVTLNRRILVAFIIGDSHTIRPVIIFFIVPVKVIGGQSGRSIYGQNL